MSQSAIMRYVYETVFNALEILGKETRLFSAEKGCKKEDPTGGLSTVYLGVSDISQLVLDKNSQKIIVDEKSWEVPTRIGMVLSLTVVSDIWPDILETIGCIIRFFKDTNGFSLDKFAWHDDIDGVFYIEPLIRDTLINSVRNVEHSPSLTLEYRIELGINSERGTPFKRVEKKEIVGKNIGK